MVKSDNVLNASQAAAFLGAHVETIRRLARKGEIPAYKMGKNWRFQKKALMDWAETYYLRRQSPLVLVIDDDAGVRRVMKRYLESDGYRVCLASDGMDGLMCLNRESVKLILLDLKMEKMDGPAFLREFRKTHQSLPVIVFTGYPDGDLMVEALKYGPFTLLAKPIEREQLLQAVRTAVNGADTE